MEPDIVFPNVLSDDTDFSIEGIIEYNNVPLLSLDQNLISGEQIFDYSVQECETPVILDNTQETNRELSILGISMNEHDDYITVGVVLAIAAVVWYTKTYIEYHFAKKIEDYKNK